MAKKTTQRRNSAKSQATVPASITTVHYVGDVKCNTLEEAEALLTTMQHSGRQTQFVKTLLKTNSPRYAGAYRPAFEHLAKYLIGAGEDAAKELLGSLFGDAVMAAAPAKAPTAAAPKTRRKHTMVPAEAAAPKTRRKRTPSAPPEPEAKPSPLAALLPPPPPPPGV